MSGSYCHRVFAASICVLVFGVSLTTAHDHQQQAAEPIPGDTKSENTEVANEIKKKWSAQDVVRDLEHIKQDLAKLIELEGAGAMSQQELAFYYLRMHDFDNNNLLDGHEIMAAMHHKHEARQGESGTVHAHHTLDELIEQADSALQDDMNHDGFLSYAEIRAAMNKRR
uniref:Putative multiple coagulation factor deficiency 2-like protein n=1 Tax=Ixodes ricinus TaxID=34613 RepID=A0A6B0UYS0_IXORI